MSAHHGAGHEGLRRAKWPLIFLISSVLFLAVGISTVRETYRVWQVDQDINSLQAQVDYLEGKKMKFMDLMQRLDSSEALDKEARARLGLRKPGERVIVLAGLGEADASAAVAQTQPASQTDSGTLSNPQKWWQYFFHAN